MNPSHPSRQNSLGEYPASAPALEEICAARVRDQAAAFAFALSRLRDGDRRPVAAVLPRRFTAEYGLPCPHGARALAECLVLVTPATQAEALWAMEQALRSGAFSGVIGGIEEATLTQTRRLDFAAREGGSVGMMLRGSSGGLSAARRRWRVRALESAAHPFDSAAPGAERVAAELVRRRDGVPGAWMLEQDDATNRLRLAGRLAGDGLVEDRRTVAAA